MRAWICERIAAPLFDQTAPRPARASTPRDRCRPRSRTRPSPRPPSTPVRRNRSTQLDLRQARRFRQPAEAEREHIGAGQHVRRMWRRIERVVGEHFVADDRPAARSRSVRTARRDRRDAGTSRWGCSATRPGSRARDRSRLARSIDVDAPRPVILELVGHARRRIRAASGARTTDSSAAARARRLRHRTAT